MPFTTDITTIKVVVAITTPRSVRKERSLWARRASSASQKASRDDTQRLVLPWRVAVRLGVIHGRAWLKTATASPYSLERSSGEPRHFMLASSSRGSQGSGG